MPDKLMEREQTYQFRIAALALLVRLEPYLPRLEREQHYRACREVMQFLMEYERHRQAELDTLRKLLLDQLNTKLTQMPIIIMGQKEGK